MTNGQWTVFGLLLLLFALEAVRNKNVYNWLINGLNQISGAVNRK